MVYNVVDHRELKVLWDMSGLGFSNHSCLRPMQLHVVELRLQTRGQHWIVALQVHMSVTLCCLVLTLYQSH